MTTAAMVALSLAIIALAVMSLVIAARFPAPPRRAGGITDPAALPACPACGSAAVCPVCLEFRP